jgi:hypothetical protein
VQVQEAATLLQDAQMVTFQRAQAFKSIERYAKLIQNVTIIVGIFTGVVSLFATQYDRRVSKTVEMTKFYTDKVRADYLNVIGQWNSYTKSIGNFFQREPAEMQQDILKFFADEKVRNLTHNYLDFFDLLWVCIDNRACDRNAAIEFFEPSAHLSYEIMAYHIVDTRDHDRDPAFGRGLEKLYGLPREHCVGKFF